MGDPPYIHTRSRILTEDGETEEAQEAKVQDLDTAREKLEVAMGNLH